MLQNSKAGLYNLMERNWNYRPLHAWDRKYTANMNKMFQTQVVVMSTWKVDHTCIMKHHYIIPYLLIYEINDTFFQKDMFMSPLLQSHVLNLSGCGGHTPEKWLELGCLNTWTGLRYSFFHKRHAHVHLLTHFSNDKITGGNEYHFQMV